MRKTTEEWLQRIAERAAELNEHTNHVNEQLEEIEDRLTQIGVGVSTEGRDVRVDVNGAPWSIGYRKIVAAAGNGWRLAAWESGGPVNGEIRALLSCPRAVRAAALDVIDSVLFNILERQKELIMKITGVVL